MEKATRFVGKSDFGSGEERFRILSDWEAVEIYYSYFAVSDLFTSPN